MKRSTGSGARIAMLAVAALAIPGTAARAASYAVVPERSELVVRTFKAGIASALAHDHVARATRFSGTIDYDPASPATASVEVAVEAASVVVDEPELRQRHQVGKAVSEKDRAKIQETMEGPEQLDVARFPDIAFRSKRVLPAAAGGLEIVGDFTLHGVTRKVSLPVRVELDGETLRAHGSFRFLQSDYGIEPFSGGLGTVRNRDEVELSVRLEARASP